MQFYSPMTCMNAYLMEPFFAQVLGLLFGIDKFPGVVTIIGVIAVTFATVMVNKGSATMLREKQRSVIPVQVHGAAGAGGGADLEAPSSKQLQQQTGSEEELSHL